MLHRTPPSSRIPHIAVTERTHVGVGTSSCPRAPLPVSAVRRSRSPHPIPCPPPRPPKKNASRRSPAIPQFPSPAAAAARRGARRTIAGAHPASHLCLPAPPDDDSRSLVSASLPRCPSGPCSMGARMHACMARTTHRLGVRPADIRDGGGKLPDYEGGGGEDHPRPGRAARGEARRGGRSRGGWGSIAAKRRSLDVQENPAGGRGGGGGTACVRAGGKWKKPATGTDDDGAVRSLY